MNQKKHIHFIAIGGAAMHNLALTLNEQGYHVTGSDDEIFEPARSRLKTKGLLPETIGWDPSRITSATEAVILGMHAKEDNPELLRAGDLGARIYSYPEYLYEQTRNKTRVVIAGSHGKTTITAMIIHVLKKYNKKIDYMVGSQIEGFKSMVSLEPDSEIAIFEGDEYLSSPIDRRPKFLHYKPDIALISGIAWDHINVFPTFEVYKEQFSLLADSVEEGGKLIYCEEDNDLIAVATGAKKEIETIPYRTPDYRVNNEKVFIRMLEGDEVPLQIFGKHNLQNMEGARGVCNLLGIGDKEFFNAMKEFKGTAKRLQKIHEDNDRLIYLDFAHSPSKVKATVDAVKEQYQQRQLIAILELHTFSSLNPEFIPQYKGCMDRADTAVVFYNQDVLNHKNMVSLHKDFIHRSFQKDGLSILSSVNELKKYLLKTDPDDAVVLLMSSGNFGGLDAKQLILDKKER